MSRGFDGPEIDDFHGPEHDVSHGPESKSRAGWDTVRRLERIRGQEKLADQRDQEALRKLRLRLDARDQNVLQIVRRGESLFFGQWVDTFMENYSKPTYRTQKTHVANLRAVKHLKAAFASRKLLDISPDDVESYLRKRMRQRALIKTALGYREGRPLKASDRSSGAEGTSADFERCSSQAIDSV